jgi:hypothetical protein
MKKFLVLVLLGLFSTSCTYGKVMDIKSPCVSADGGPCGPKQSINDWWLNNNIKS